MAQQSHRRSCPILGAASTLLCGPGTEAAGIGLKRDSLASVMSSAQFEDTPLGAWRDSAGRPRCRYRFGGQTVNVLIRVRWVVVKQYHVFHCSQGSEGDGVLEGAMPPTDALGIFLATVLGIMDQQVRASSKGVPGCPLPT